MLKLELLAGRIFTLKGTAICTPSNGDRAVTMCAGATPFKLDSTMISKKKGDNNPCSSAGCALDNWHDWAMISRRSVRGATRARPERSHDLCTLIKLLKKLHAFLSRKRNGLLALKLALKCCLRCLATATCLAVSKCLC